MLVFRNDSVEPEIYRHKEYLEGNSDELPEKVSGVWLATGGVNLFTSLEDLTAEEKALISDNILQKGDFYDKNEFETAFAKLYEQWEYAYVQNEQFRPRTAIGYNSIAQKVVLAIIYKTENAKYIYNGDFMPDTNKGANLYDVRQIMKYLGCNKVLNPDGGGSTRISYKDGEKTQYCYVERREVYADLFLNPNVLDRVLWATTD